MIAEEGKAGRKVGEKWSAKMVPSPAASNTFSAFLAANFGEDIHARLLRDTSTTFDEAFENQTKPYHLPELFEEFRSWLARTATPRP